MSMYRRPCDERDVRVDIYRPARSDDGEFHVLGVRLVHIPTGIVITKFGESELRCVNAAYDELGRRLN